MVTKEQELIKEIEETRVMLQTYLASDMDIDKMDFNEVINYAISDINDQNIFLGHWKDYAFLRGELKGIQSQKQKIIEEIEKIPANETYCLDCEAGFDEDSNECFRCDGKNIVHRKLEISREELLKTLGKKQ